MKIKIEINNNDICEGSSKCSDHDSRQEKNQYGIWSIIEVVNAKI